jgi:hypothetical protein
VDVTTGHEEIAGPSFNEARRGTKVLDLPRIGGGGHQHGIPTWFCRTMHVRPQVDAIAHGDTNILVLAHEVGGLRQIAIFAAGGLRSVETTLTGFYPGRWNANHFASSRTPYSKSH